MYKRILIPLDGSGKDESAIAHADRLAAPDAEFILLHSVAPATVPAGFAGVDTGETPEQARTYLEGISLPSGRKPWIRVIQGQDASEAILKDARELGVDLIAMSTHGRSGLSRALMGSVAEGVVRGSEIPVILSRPDVPKPAGSIRRILVPVDGSERSYAILEDIVPLAREKVAEVVMFQALNVAPLVDPISGVSLPKLPPGTPKPSPGFETRAEKLRKRGIKVSTRVIYGSAVNSILECAKECEADLIAMATEGRDGLNRVMLGSVAESVLREAKRPVLLRKAG